ncbi:MAG TPA: HipA domain-containing protein, partial [Polyangiaceae bacterium]
MRTNAPTTLSEVLGSRGPQGARELIASLGVSQSTLSRGIHALGQRVRRIGRGRATKYALARAVSTFGSEWPAHRIEENGRARAVGRLHAIAPTGWWYETTQPAPALVPAGGDAGVFRDLPWFLDDLRPQGFMGRAFAGRYGRALGLPEDPRLWSADAVLVTLLLHGEDLPGDWVIGEDSIGKAQQLRLNPPEAIPARDRLVRYAALAEEALSGAPVGSSAAGEQPKFTTRVRDRDGTARDVIVKVSPPLSSPMGLRWADLLVCESLAAALLADAGIAASRTEWLLGDRRAFLEVTRFDRTVAGGRLGLISLLALDSELYGLLDTWALAGVRLAKDGYLTEAH